MSTESLALPAVRRSRLVACCALLVGLALVQDPGLLVPDTKFDLVAAPGDWLTRALHVWDAEGGFGQVQNQAHGYLWPMGPFFWLLHTVGIPGWVVQRLWQSLVLCVAMAGTAKPGPRPRCPLRPGLPRRRLRLRALAADAHLARPDLDRGLAERARPLGAAAAGDRSRARVPAPRGGTVGAGGRDGGRRQRGGVLRRRTARGGVDPDPHARPAPARAAAVVAGVRGAGDAVVDRAAAGDGRLQPALPRLHRDQCGDHLSDHALRRAARNLPLGPLRRRGLPGRQRVDPHLLARRQHRRRGRRRAGRAPRPTYAAPHVPRPRPALRTPAGHRGAPRRGARLVLGRHRRADSTGPSRRCATCTSSTRCYGCRSSWAWRSCWTARSPRGAGPTASGSTPGSSSEPWCSASSAPPRPRSPPVRRPRARCSACRTTGSRRRTTSPRAPGVGRRCWCPARRSRSTCGEIRRTSRCSGWRARAGACATRGSSPSRGRSGCWRAWSGGSPRGTARPGSPRRCAGRVSSKLVVRNDLRATDDVPDTALVHQAIEDSPGLERVATFGPLVGGEAWERDGDRRTVRDGGRQASYPAVEVFTVPGAEDAVTTSDPSVVAAGPEDLADLVDAGVLGQAPVRFAADADPDDDAGRPRRVVLTDGLRARERQFSRMHDGASATITPGDVRRTTGPVRDFPLGGDTDDRWSTTARLEGAAALSASSSASDAGALGGSDRGRLPYAAVDGDTATAWASDPTDPAPWWRMELDDAARVTRVGLTAAADAGTQRVRVVTAAGRSAVVEPEPRRHPAGPRRRRRHDALGSRRGRRSRAGHRAGARRRRPARGGRAQGARPATAARVVGDPGRGGAASRPGRPHRLRGRRWQPALRRAHPAQR
ncbi:DUF3367 domain-containing protein [Nocardioides sp. W3-2-3]|uniref:alpha-(1->3)-arabinofuranosyltransferase domain-containing protein n=1 Tax=Nocardioides convexus TaxID=2712224 RepID=UPI0024182B88|nr:alpha-(1->3)-arabinofuranosyltransferase family protein [Nocardioides convexus]NGZ99945.1 DUF3367 domain-containing protein [Nocardioides convexus]